MVWTSVVGDLPELCQSLFFFFFNLFILFIYFWLCWVFVAARSFSSCGVWGLLFVAVHGLLIAVASLVCTACALGT